MDHWNEEARKYLLKEHGINVPLIEVMENEMVGTDIGNRYVPDIIAYPNGKSPTTTQFGTQSFVDNGLTKPLKGEL